MLRLVDGKDLLWWISFSEDRGAETAMSCEMALMSQAITWFWCLCFNHFAYSTSFLIKLICVLHWALVQYHALFRISFNSTIPEFYMFGAMDMYVLWFHLCLINQWCSRFLAFLAGNNHCKSYKTIPTCCLVGKLSWICDYTKACSKDEHEVFSM